MTLHSVYTTLYAHFGPQHWWPGDSPFEVMVGAVLTQNTAWTNVEKAITNLRANNALWPEAIVQLPHETLAALIRPAGYFNVKSKRLKNYCQWYLEQGEKASLDKWTDHDLRQGLLSVNGVGPETADDMLLYAFDRPVFVIDAYTRRLFSRLGLVVGDEGYETLRHLFEQTLTEQTPAELIDDRDAQTKLFNEYHALIVIHAKDYCRKRPQCENCCLVSCCRLDYS